VAITPAPGDIRDLADAAGRVEVRFDVPTARTGRTRASVTTVIDAPLRLRSQWEDDRTLVFQVSRAPVPGEVVRIEIDRLVDALGRPLTEAIRVTFE